LANAIILYFTAMPEFLLKLTELPVLLVSGAAFDVKSGWRVNLTVKIHLIETFIIRWYSPPS
jgi:hypothetical protein